MWVTALLVFCWVPSAVAEEIDFVEFQKIVDTQCSKCHDRERIEQAMEQGLAFQPIEEKMINHGARLTDHERDVMGVFWDAVPEENPDATAAKDDLLGEYRSVLDARCTGCHTLEKVEAAMRENRSFDALAKMMLKRGAVLTEADHKVLGTFWGEPLR